MTARRIRRACALGLALALANTAVAAQATTARFDTSAVRVYTIDALVRATRSAVSLIRGNDANARVVEIVDSLLERVDRPAVTRLSLGVLASAQLEGDGAPQASFGTVARWQRRPVVPGLGAGDAADLAALASITVSDVRFAMEARVPPVPDDSVDILLTPYTALQREQLIQSLAVSLEKLNRFERKYGPAAPRLNIVEVGLNYVAQWVPPFRPDSTGWPSRFEVIAAYVPTYLTIVDEKASAVTVGEVGLRSYIWRRGWGGAAGGIWRPGYVSFGVAVAGDRDGAFVSPLRGSPRVGAFLGWGETKVAFLGGSRHRFLITRQIQLVPWAF